MFVVSFLILCVALVEVIFFLYLRARSAKLDLKYEILSSIEHDTFRKNQEAEKLYKEATSMYKESSSLVSDIRSDFSVN